MTLGKTVGLIQLQIYIDLNQCQLDLICDHSNENSIDKLKCPAQYLLISITNTMRIDILKPFPWLLNNNTSLSDPVMILYMVVKINLLQYLLIWYNRRVTDRLVFASELYINMLRPQLIVKWLWLRYLRDLMRDIIVRNLMSPLTEVYQKYSYTAVTMYVVSLLLLQVRIILVLFVRR